MVGDLRRLLPRNVHPSVETVGFAAERNDQSFEPEVPTQHHGQRAPQRHYLWDRRLFGHHLFGLGVGQVDVRQLSDPGRERLVERPQDLLTRGDRVERAGTAARPANAASWAATRM